MKSIKSVTTGKAGGLKDLEPLKAACSKDLRTTFGGQVVGYSFGRLWEIAFTSVRVLRVGLRTAKQNEVRWRVTLSFKSILLPTPTKPHLILHMFPDYEIPPESALDQATGSFQ